MSLGSTGRRATLRSETSRPLFSSRATKRATAAGSARSISRAFRARSPPSGTGIAASAAWFPTGLRRASIGAYSTCLASRSSSSSGSSDSAAGRAPSGALPPAAPNRGAKTPFTNSQISGTERKFVVSRTSAAPRASRCSLTCR